MDETKSQYLHAVDDLGIHPDVVMAMNAGGISTVTLLQFLISYGPAALMFLAQALGIKLPPSPLPTPPPLPPLPISSM